MPGKAFLRRFRSAACATVEERPFQGRVRLPKTSWALAPERPLAQLVNHGLFHRVYSR